MTDSSPRVTPWITFGGGVLVIVVLYWAQAVLVPSALAVQLTFVLTPPPTPVTIGATWSIDRRAGPASPSRREPIATREDRGGESAVGLQAHSIEWHSVSATEVLR
jgi:hypothetical protein